MRQLKISGYINVFGIDGKPTGGGIIYTQSGEIVLMENDQQVAKLARARAEHLPNYLDTVKIITKVSIEDEYKPRKKKGKIEDGSDTESTNENINNDDTKTEAKPE